MDGYESDSCYTYLNVLIVFILQSVRSNVLYCVFQAGKFNIIPTVIAIGTGFAIMGMVSFFNRFVYSFVSNRHTGPPKYIPLGFYVM